MTEGVAQPTTILQQIRDTYQELQSGTGRSLPPWAYRAFYPVKILARALDEFVRDQGITRASGLAFVTLLAAVPLTFVVFQLFSSSAQGMAAREEVQDWLFRYLVPTRADEVKSFLLGAVQKGSTTLAPFAVGMLVVTCLLLLNNIERTFNAIWGVTRPRPLIRRVGAYWIVLTMPMLLVTISQVATTQINAWLQRSVGGLPFLYALALRLLGMVPTWLGFTCAYLFVPYTIVRARAALVGGIAAGLVWELSKAGYIFYSKNMFRNIETLYGPLSTIPVTLIWLYVSWLIVLFGAEIAFAVQFPDRTVSRSGSAASSQRVFREYFAVRVMTEIVRHYMQGTSEGASSHELAATLETPPDVLLPLLNNLRAHGLLLITDDETWVPARPPDSITVQHVVSATSEQSFGVPPGLTDELSQDLGSHFAAVRETMREQLASLTLTDLARRALT